MMRLRFPRRGAATAAFLLAALAWPALGAGPDLAELFQMALRPPVAAYQGRVLVSVRHGDENQSAEMEVAFRPPRGYRYTVYGDDQALESTVLVDGDTELTYEPGSGRSWKRTMSLFTNRPLGWRQNLALLKQNYGVRRIGRETIAGRAADGLQFTPLHPEVPIEQIFIDPATGAILKTHSYLPDGSWDYSASFTRVSFPAALRPEEFSLEIPMGTRVAVDAVQSSFFSTQELLARMPAVRAPDRLPRGFHFESATLKTLHDRELAHLRYGDGLNIISVFESTGTLPWQVPAGAETFQLAGRPAWLAVIQEQTLLGWADGPWQGLVMGAMSRETLTRLAESLMRVNPAASPRPIPKIKQAKGE